MIDEKKLIEELLHNDRMNFTVKLHDFTPEGVGVFVREYTDKMKEGFINLINAQPKIRFGVDLAQRENAWIPVTERLSEEDGEYITMTNAKGKSKGVLAQNYKTSFVRGQKLRRWYWNYRLSPWNITHWMPMPEPPKEGEI